MATSNARSDPALWIVLALLLGFVVPAALMTAFWGRGMMGGSWMDGNWGAWGLAPFVGLAIVLVLIVLLARAIQVIPDRPALVHPVTAPPNPADAWSILDARYAKGEITREEYVRMRADLVRPAH